MSDMPNEDELEDALVAAARSDDAWQLRNLADRGGTNTTVLRSAALELDRLVEVEGELSRVAGQIDRLVAFILTNVPGEPSGSYGAVDCAIAVIERLQAEVARLNDENERLSFDYERLAGRKVTDEVDQWRALADDVFTWIEAYSPSGTKAQLNAQFGALDGLIARYRELRDR